MNFLIPEKRGENNSPKKNDFKFKEFKKNTICSLNSVEYFLNNINHACKYIKLYKILK